MQSIEVLSTACKPSFFSVFRGEKNKMCERIHSLKNQKPRAMKSKLRCEAVFALIETTLDDAAKELSLFISRNSEIGIRGLLWKRPLNDAWSFEDVKLPPFPSPSFILFVALPGI